MKYSFSLRKDKKHPEWWIVGVNQVEGFEIEFRHQQYNTTKRLILPDETDLTREQGEEILKQMSAWLMKYYYGIVTDQNTDFQELPLSRQLQRAMADAGVSIEELAMNTGCKTSRIKHVLEERYESINLAFFIKALDSMGYGLTLFKQREALCSDKPQPIASGRADDTDVLYREIFDEEER